MIICDSQSGQAQQLSKTNYGVNSPLKTNTIYDIHFSSNNLLYIATDNGLWSYDGISFEEYKLSIEFSSELHNIQENSDGDIFVMDFNGNVFELEEDSLVLFPTGIDKKIDYLLILENYTYYAGKSFIFSQHQQTGKLHKITLPKNSDYIYGLSDNGFFYASDAPNKLYLGQVRDTMLVIAKDKPQKSSASKVFKNDYKGSWCDFDDAEQNIISSQNDTILKLKEVPKELSIYKTRIIHNQLVILCKEGLYLPVKKQFFMDRNFVNEVLTDHEGNIWIATLTSGLYKTSNFKNYHYPLNNPSTEVDFIFADNNKIIYSDKVGKLYQWDDDQQSFALFYENKYKGQLKNISYDRQNQQYITSGNQVVFFDNNLKIKAEHTGYGKFTRAGSDDFYTKKSNNQLIYGLFSDYLRYKQNGAKKTLTHQKPLFSISQWIPLQMFDIRLPPNKSTKDITAWGNYILTTLNDSLLFIRKTTDSVQRAVPFSNIQKLSLNNNRLFVITEKNIIEVDTNGHSIGIIKRTGGLERRIRNISVDHQHISITTKQIIYLLDANNYKHLHQFTTQNGITSPDFNRAWLYRKKLYVNGNRGIDEIILEEPYNKGKADLKIAKVLVNNKEKRGTVFSYQENNIELVFEVRSYTTSGHLKWRLNNKKWKINKAKNKSVQLDELQAGSYTIEVCFENKLGVTSNLVKYVFVIQKPYWQTWWFYALFFLGGMAGVSIIIWGFIRNKRKEERLQNQNNLLRMQALQTQMNPHFIFNVQAAIQGLWLRGSEEAALSLQNKFSKLLRKIFQYSGHLTISIEQLVEFLENYIALEKIRFKNEVQVEFEIDPSLLDGDYFVPPLLVQPIVENSFKHGLLHRENNRKLLIELKNHSPYLYCIIQDNGVGRKSDPKLNLKNPRKSSGLKTTQSRLILLQESMLKMAHPQNNLKITDLKNDNNQPIGTKVELWIPFTDFQEVS